MNKILTLCFLALISMSASAQVFDPAKLAQQQRQQASKGAAAAQAAQSKAGLVGVAELSSACFKEAQSGSRSSDYCLGIEALGRSVRDSSPDADANAKDWFRHPKMTERVMAHCTLFLGIQDEMSCAMRLAAAKMAIPTETQTQQKQKSSPAFDCSFARTRVERMICSSEELAKLDVSLSEVFNLAKDEHPLSVNGDTGETSFPLGADQARWRTKVRDICKDEACVKMAYEKRAIEIKTKFPY